jgi:hypothetical protein
VPAPPAGPRATTAGASAAGPPTAVGHPGARIGDADAGHQFFGVDALVQDGIVDREEQAAIAGLHQRIDSLQQHAITAREDLPLRLVAFDGVGEQQERRQCIALVVRAFLVVSVGREQQVDLAKEAEPVILLAPAQGLLHQLRIAQYVAGHAGGGHRPRGVVMDLVVVLRLADEELGHRPEHLDSMVSRSSADSASRIAS